jgi:serine protease Do
MEETPNVAPSQSSIQTPSRRNWVVPVLLVLTLLSGISIGILLSGGASARQAGHVLTVGNGEGAVTGSIATALALSDAFAQVARAVEPAVVHIEVESNNNDGKPDPFDRFFGRPHGGVRRGSGSGVIVDPAGYILTNNHVVENAATIRVKTFDGKTLKPEVIGFDAETDLAVIKVSRSEPFPFAKMGDSSRLKVGDWVLAIGSPFGLEQTVTAGIISAKDRTTDGGASQFQKFLQTDAAINPGNSGGPLINLTGEVIGINTQISTSTGTFNGVGFALPSSLAVEIYNQLVSNGRVTRGFLGVFLTPVTPQVARLNGLKEPRGALVQGVTAEDSPAAQAGLRTGDVIIEFEGQPIEDTRDLTRRVAATEVGRTVRVKYIRDGREYVTSVKLGMRPSANERAALGPPEEKPAEPEPKKPEKKNQPGRPSLGARLEPVPPQVAGTLKLGSTKGALIAELDDDGLALEIGLNPGDVILSINRREVGSPEAVKQMIEGLKSGDDIVILVARPGRRGGPDRAILSGTIP